MIRKQISTIITTIIIILVIPHILSSGLVNLGMLDLRDNLFRQDISSIYPFSEVKIQTGVDLTKFSYFDLATKIDNKNGNAFWALGRIALLTGNYSQAANALKRSESVALNQPLLYQDLFIALSQAGMDKDVIALFGEFPSLVKSSITKDYLVLAHLNLSKHQNERTEHLKQVIKIHPTDLYANYFLWRQALESGDTSNEKFYSQKLTDFSARSLIPVDLRLLNYTCDVIPYLHHASLWDKEKTLDVISFLVWKYYGDENVLQLIENMVNQYPSQAEWRFYLAEYYHREGNLEQAKTIYQQVVELDPEYPQAQLRLSVITKKNQREILFIPHPTSQDYIQKLALEKQVQCAGSASIIYEAEKLPRLIGEVIQDSQATGGKAVYSDLQGGVLSYGPYISLPRGVYKIVYRIKVGEHRQGNIAIFDINDLPSGALNQFPVWKVKDTKITPYRYQDIILLFENYLYSGGKQMEFRTQVYPRQEIWLDHIRLCRIDIGFDG